MDDEYTLFDGADPDTLFRDAIYYLSHQFHAGANNRPAIPFKEWNQRTSEEKYGAMARDENEYLPSIMEISEGAYSDVEIPTATRNQRQFDAGVPEFACGG